jgi:hypothetical protein
MRKHGKNGAGYRQYPDEYLLGLHRLPISHIAMLNAKVCVSKESRMAVGRTSSLTSGMQRWSYAIASERRRQTKEAEQTG